MSEGIDFSDGHCRAVLIVGLPFPNSKDLQLRLKKEDHDIKSRANPRFLNGSAWYALQVRTKECEHGLGLNQWKKAFRALNQAIGRCIRHRNDFGAIILLDERFLEKKNQDNMSKWIRPVVAAQTNFREAISSLASFFARNMELIKQPAISEITASDVKKNVRRWCCAKCARPVCLAADPKPILIDKPRVVRFDFYGEGAFFVQWLLQMEEGVHRRCC